MRTQRVSSLVMLAMAGLLATVSMKGCDKKAKAAEMAQPTAPDGYVMVEEDILTYLVDGPKEHFTKAHDSFLKKDYHISAGEIRKGAAYLKLQAAQATVEGKKVLTDAIKDLDQLATNVETGAVKDVKILDQGFARAHHALAQHHYLQAMQYKSKGLIAKTGHALKAATMHLENGLAFSGHKVEASTAKVVKDAKMLCGKLTQGTGWVAEEVGKGIGSVGEEIAKLGKLSEPTKAAPKK